MDKTILTAKEAAVIMRVSPSAMYQLVRENRVPHIKVGKRKVIPAARLYAWLDGCVEGG